MLNDVLFSSESDHWETPKDLFSLLDAEFGFTWILVQMQTIINASVITPKRTTDCSRTGRAMLCFVTLHMDAKLQNGWKKHTKRDTKKIPLS